MTEDKEIPARAEDGNLLADWMTRKEMASELKVSLETLKRWEQLRTAPPFTRLGVRVLYNRGAFRKWLLDKLHSENGGRRK